MSQSLEQEVHSVHEARTQSFSQASTLHCCVSPRLPHCFPPCCIGVLTSRTRFCIPPPHFEEHLLQPPHSASTQFTGQGPRLQLLSAASGKHFVPPDAWVS